MAALLTETVGAGVVAKALAFENVAAYIEGEGTPKWGFDAHADLARAKAGSESLGGLTLIGCGLVGQALTAVGVRDPSCTLAIVPSATGALAILAVLVAIPRVTLARLTRMVRARLRQPTDYAPKHWIEVLNGYARSLVVGGYPIPPPYGVRAFVESILGDEILAETPAESIRERDWCRWPFSTLQPDRPG